MSTTRNKTPKGKLNLFFYKQFESQLNKSLIELGYDEAAINNIKKEFSDLIPDHSMAVFFNNHTQLVDVCRNLENNALLAIFKFMLWTRVQYNINIIWNDNKNNKLKDVILSQNKETQFELLMHVIKSRHDVNGFIREYIATKIIKMRLSVSSKMPMTILMYQQQ
jgi:hypothetical protein